MIKNRKIERQSSSSKMFNMLFTGTLVICIILFIYLVINIGDSSSVMKTYDRLNSGSKLYGTKKLSFLTTYMTSTGDYSIVNRLGLSEKEIEEIVGIVSSSFEKVVISSDTQAIINMSEEQIWYMISEGRFKSYKEVNTYCRNNKSEMESFWNSLQETITVPVWKWEDSSKTSKIESTMKVTVNKYLKQYFIDYLTALHNLPEQYVINTLYGYSYRTKNNASASSDYSSHSFGTAIDINPETDGMGSVPAGISNGHPWKSRSGLSDPILSEACTYDSSWFQLAEQYSLDWGGNWSERSLDPMHFSLVGDGNKDTRIFIPKYKGR